MNKQPSSRPEPVDLKERNWLPRYCRGDEQAFDELLLAYRSLVNSFLFRYGIEGRHRDDLFQDIFLKINGIDGESQDSSHKNEIEVLVWDWNIEQQSNMHAGSGGGAGKATVSDLSFEHYVDRASPNLMKYCLTGKHIDQATLVVRKAGGNPLEYLKLTMSDVIVTRVAPRGAATGAT